MIRDVATGRYLDVDKLHYVDFESADSDFARTYSTSRGPRSFPAAPGQLPVLARAGAVWCRITCRRCRGRPGIRPDAGASAAEVTATRAAYGPLRGRFRTGRGPALIAELDVVLDARGQGAAARLAALDAFTPVAQFPGALRRNCGGTDRTDRLGLLEVADGVRLHPAVLDVDLEELGQLVLPALRRRGVLAPAVQDATFRDQLGLGRPQPAMARGGRRRRWPGKLRREP